MNLTRTRATIRHIGAVICVALFPWPVSAAVELDPVCASAPVRVTGESGVPHEVLVATTPTETGRVADGATRTRPRTIISEGKLFWFDSWGEALRFADSQLAKGTTSVELRRFQIDCRWHDKNFESVGEMSDPVADARSAIRFLPGSRLIPLTHPTRALR